MAARGGLWATGQVAGCGLWDGQEVVSVQGERLRFGSLKEVVTRWAGPVGRARTLGPSSIKAWVRPECFDLST